MLNLLNKDRLPGNVGFSQAPYVEVKTSYDVQAILQGLENLLLISTKRPSEIISSADVANGKHPDTWFRKGKFTTTLTYFQMLLAENAISDRRLVRRIQKFQSMCRGRNFKSTIDTTPTQVRQAFQLVSDVVQYLNKKAERNGCFH